MILTFDVTITKMEKSRRLSSSATGGYSGHRNSECGDWEFGDHDRSKSRRKNLFFSFTLCVEIAAFVFLLLPNMRSIRFLSSAYTAHESSFSRSGGSGANSRTWLVRCRGWDRCLALANGKAGWQMGNAVTRSPAFVPWCRNSCAPVISTHPTAYHQFGHHGHEPSISVRLR